jgi:rod shape-determining protein MreD
MRAADLTPVSRDAMTRPAGGRLVLASFLAAFVLQSLPWQDATLLARPDFVLLVLLFWVVNEPRMIGLGMAFSLGLLVDVNDSMLLGQHALAYVVAAFFAQSLRVRIHSFALPEQALHVLGLAVLATLITLLLNLLLGQDFPGWAILVSPPLTALAWFPMAWLLNHPRLRATRRLGAS